MFCTFVDNLADSSDDKTLANIANRGDGSPDLDSHHKPTTPVPAKDALPNGNMTMPLTRYGGC